MHLCFIDESGSPPTSANGPHKYFVIAGLIIPETQWHDVANEFQKLKDRLEFQVRGEIKWRYFGAANSDPKNTVKHLDQAARDKFRKAIFDIIVARNSIKIVACVASAVSCYSTSYIHNADDVYEYTYKPVTERFQYFLQELSREGGIKVNGMIIADHRGKRQDESLRRHHHKLLFSRSDFISKYDNYIESIFFTDSRASVGIQLADMVAGAIGRYFNSNDSTFFNQIKSSFRTDNRGRIEGWGLVKMPTAGWM